MAHQPARPSRARSSKAGTGSRPHAVSAAAEPAVPSAASIRWRIAVTTAARGEGQRVLGRAVHRRCLRPGEGRRRPGGRHDLRRPRRLPDGRYRPAQPLPRHRPRSHDVGGNHPGLAIGFWDLFLYPLAGRQHERRTRSIWWCHRSRHGRGTRPQEERHVDRCRTAPVAARLHSIPRAARDALSYGSKWSVPYGFSMSSALSVAAASGPSVVRRAASSCSASST